MPPLEEEAYLLPLLNPPPPASVYVHGPSIVDLAGGPLRLSNVEILSQADPYSSNLASLAPLSH